MSFFVWVLLGVVIGYLGRPHHAAASPTRARSA